MPGKRITDLTALSGANSANNDDLVIFDATASETKRISRSQLAEGMVTDLPLQYYLGVLTANPTQRLNGDALQIGDYYLDSVTKFTTIYNGSGWNSYASVIAAQAAAEAARDAAQLAQTNAETAETNAETARDAAQLAQTNAETAETNAETAETGAVVARVAAEAAKTDAETAEANATAAAAMSGTIYADEAAGRAAVADGEFYLAVGSTSEKAVDVWRRDNASNSTLMRSYADLSVVQEIVDDYPAARLASAEAVATNKITENAGAVTPSVYDGYVWVSGTEYQITAFARAGERTLLNLFCNAGFQFNVTFNLANGTASGSGGAISEVGNGWYRCRVTGTAGASASGNLQVRMLSAAGATGYTGDGSSGLYVDRVSMVDTSAPAVELLPQTDISNAAWTKLGVTVNGSTVDNLVERGASGAAYEAIFGVDSADKFIEALDAAATPTCFRGLTPTSGLTYIHKVVAKAGERYRMNLFNNGGLNYNCMFDLLRGTATGTGASIVHLGEGWYECTVTKAATSATSGNCQIRIFPGVGGQPYSADGSSGFYVNSASLLQGGTELWGSDANLFGSSAWSKIDLTVDPDVANYRTIKLDGPQGEGVAYYAGKKWAALGTSITDQNRYFPVLENLLGVVGQNLGVSGASLAAGSHYGALGIYNEIVNIDSDSELVTLEAGTNDFGARNSTLGTLGDTTTATFYGALYAAVVAIQAQAPNALIVFFTPYGSDSRFPLYTALPSNVNSDGDSLLDFQQAVRDVANLLGLPCIDVGSEAGFGYLTNTLWTYDGLHPNDNGGERFATYVKAKLDEIGAAGLI